MPKERNKADSYREKGGTCDVDNIVGEYQGLKDFFGFENKYDTLNRSAMKETLCSAKNPTN